MALEAVGLSATESRVYATLIDHPRCTATEAAGYAGVTPALAARILAAFARRGLASRLPGRRARYVAVPPDISIQPLLTRREAELDQVRTALRQMVAAFHRATRYTHPAELVEVVTGAQNVISRAYALQEAARRQMRAFVKPPYVMEGGENAGSELRRLREGIGYRVLYDRETLLLPGALDDVLLTVQAGEQARVADVPLKLWIADDSAALIPIRGATYGQDAAFVVHPSAVLDALIALFEREWQHGTPLRGPSSVPGPDAAGRRATAASDGPDNSARTLLALLAAGVTDEGVARSLGISVRTVQRRVHELMEELGVRTRFQAGMAAKERGWV